MSAPRRPSRAVVAALLLAVAVLALGQTPWMASWAAVWALLSLGLVLTAFVLALRQTSPRGSRRPGARR